MRGLLANADLARYTGQFVWLELNYDRAENRTFLDQYGANATPTFFIIDPLNGNVTATQIGAMSLSELKQFLHRGAAGVLAKTQMPSDAALKHGDALLAEKPADAVRAYREALRLAPTAWSRRELAEGSLVIALQGSHQWQECAQTAAGSAAKMSRDSMFGRTVMAGMWCLVSTDAESWTKDAAAKLEPLAKEALSLPTTVRDHRDELYRTLMHLALSRNDRAAAAKWGNQWLRELDSVKPANNEERSAVDIARVEKVQVLGDPKEVLPALIASERTMSRDWNASLRVAQMELTANNYDAAVAACDRGVSRGPGPAGRSWLLRTKAEALSKKGQSSSARQALREALQAAEEIPAGQIRMNNVNRIQKALREPVQHQ